MEANVMLIITTALTVGLGCGSCCSPVISMFLSTYVVSHSDGVKRGVASFASFYLGKAISVSLMCMAAAFISQRFIGADGYIGGFNLRLFAQIVMSGIGLALALKWIINNKKHKGCQIVKDLSRITRDYVAADAWIDRLIVSGVALITADCQQPVKLMFQRYAALF